MTSLKYIFLKLDMLLLPVYTILNLYNDKIKIFSANNLSYYFIHIFLLFTYLILFLLLLISSNNNPKSLLLIAN